MQKNIKKENLMKSIMIAFAIFFIIVAPCSSAPIQDDIKKDTTVLVETIIFEDDFNNGILDPEKWTMIGNGGGGGTVEVVNGQLEIQCYEGNPTNWIGVQSRSFGGKITEEEPLIISLQMKTHISHHNGYVGNQNIRITDGTNSIHVGYFRFSDELQVYDSSGNSIVLFNSEETSLAWPVEIQIYYTGGYKVTVAGYETAVNESVISGTSFIIELVMSINGDFPSYWWRCAFDDVKAQDVSICKSYIYSKCENSKIMAKEALKHLQCIQ